MFLLRTSCAAAPPVTSCSAAPPVRQSMYHYFCLLVFKVTPAVGRNLSPESLYQIIPGIQAEEYVALFLHY